MEMLHPITGILHLNPPPLSDTTHNPTANEAAEENVIDDHPAIEFNAGIRLSFSTIRN
jgi:hypothetical protein